MEDYIYDEKNGLHYTLGEDDCYYPDLALPKEKYEIGHFGRMHFNYIKENNKVIYIQLLTSGKLNEYLHDIDVHAQDMYEMLIKQYTEKHGVTELLKAENQMEWVGRMNNIKNAVEEVVISDLLYN